MTTLLSFQKEKAKDFKSQIIRYLEAMLQSQQRVITELFQILCKYYIQHACLIILTITTYFNLLFILLLIVFQLIKFWEAFLPEAKAIA